MSHTLYLIEDHAALRESLIDLLSLEDDLEVVGASASADEALGQIRANAVDLAVVDVSLPGMSGIELVRRLRVERPETRCLMLSGHFEPAYVRQALEAGASGYVGKGDPTELIDAISAVLSGGTYVSASITGGSGEG